MKSAIYRVIIILMLLVLASFFLIEGLILISGRQEAQEEVDYLIVLGARLYGEIPSPALEERLKVTKDYLIEKKDVKVIVSGGQGLDELIAEAEAMKRYLVDNGIEEDRIILEDKSTSTFENLKFSLDLVRDIESNENLKFLIVTNKYHIFRAKFIGKRLGIDPYGLPAKIPPSIITQAYIREYFAVIKSFIFDR